MEIYECARLTRKEFAVSVPASKSILNRALLLAAFTEGDTLLSGCGNFGQDSEDLLSCLSSLGISTERAGDKICVHGAATFGKKATLNVGSAGTAARFLTAILAFSGGEYDLDASPQMKKRPMDFLDVLEREGVRIEYGEKVGHFPFRLESRGISSDVLTVDTDVSTQYASGLLLAAAVGNKPLTLLLTGSRTEGSYIQTTLDVVRAFGGNFSRAGNKITLFPIQTAAKEYAVAPDFSGACYFYALSLLCGARALVNGAHPDCGQTDLKLLDVLKEKGVKVTDTPAGMVADGGNISTFSGFDVDMQDFSDQTLTLAALAPFAATPSVLKNIGHIRKQECDRVEAILHNLTALGVPCECRGEDILIYPAPVRPATLESYGDHRVAMAFALVGLKADGIKIKDPECCKKTFGNYFEILDELTKK